MSDVFYWIGVAVVGGLALAAIVFAGLFIWANLIDGRFQLLFFKKNQRRLSLASWHESRMHKPNVADGAEWPADDYPIGARPFFLSYKIGGRQFFVMLGTLETFRHRAIEGMHP